MSTDASTHDTPTPADAVVAAVDGSHRDAAVIEWAGAEAVALSAPLHLVHAVDLGTPLSAYGELLTSPEIVDRVEQESVRVVTQARATAEAARPGLAVTTALPTGSPSGALLAAAEGAGVPGRGVRPQEPRRAHRARHDVDERRRPRPVPGGPRPREC
nr:universal stress protein [Janibacter limosus]